MKLIIAGSRHFSSAYDVVELAIKFIPELTEAYLAKEITEVVSGGAQGIDLAGERWAASSANSYSPALRTSMTSVKVTKFPAKWNTFGRAAGPMRNREMAEYADGLLLIWDGESPGSASMKREMEKLNKPVYEVIFRGPKKA